MMQLILDTVWFFLPAMIANMAPVFAAKFNWLPFLNRPLDNGAKIRDKRVFGAHKTVRGVAVGVLVGMGTAAIQYYMMQLGVVSDIALVNYSSLWFSLWLGALLGFGALFGDAVKSFVKRQLNIQPGKSWPVFDQIDFVLGALLTTFWVVSFSLQHVIAAIVTLGIASFIVSVIGVMMHIKNDV